ncbi:hypothetical protein PtB15_14B264 [Puccinia triticina]|nr:hypothetical protein PtB15_14B264 [Puccinia triticina]
MDHPIPAQLPALAQNQGAYLDAVPGRSRQDERRAHGDDCAESAFVAAGAAGDHQCDPDLAAIPGGQQRVCVGVYTPEGLAHLGAVLSGLGVQHHMRCAKEETIWMGVDRIKLLSEYHNQALLAFDNADRALDGLSNLGADSACGTDWWEAKTLREQYGLQTPHRPTTPARSRWSSTTPAIFGAKESKVFQARFHNVLPVPVYLCWNDIVALAPAPFRGPEGLTFRAADRLTNKCPSSECQLFAKDFSLGFNKCLLIPNVAVTYTRIIYYAGGVVRGSNCDNPLSRTR